MDFNSLWPPRFGNILGTCKLCSTIRAFIVIEANQIANFEMKTTSLISKLDSKFSKSTVTMIIVMIMKMKIIILIIIDEYI